MQQDNPYSTPRSELDKPLESPDEIATLNRIASGQRLMITSVAISLLSFFLQGIQPALMAVIGIMAAVMGIVGVIRITSAFGRAIVMRIIYAIAMLLPLINLLVMLLLSSQATHRLRSAGYRVGFFGANQK